MNVWGKMIAVKVAMVAALCSSLCGAEPGPILLAQGEPDRIFRITGDIHNPGEYTFQKGNSVLTALDIAGGLKKTADGTVVLLRGSVPVNIHIADCFRDPAKWDMLLKDDDIIVVGTYWDDETISPSLIDAVKLGLVLPNPIIFPTEEKEKEPVVKEKKKGFWKRVSSWWKDDK